MTRCLRLGIPFLGFCAMMCGCGESTRPRHDWNVLLVTFDTTRADHIGCFGLADIETPVLDNLAAQGIMFSNAVDTNPITAPSHTTILTGRYPLAHGIRDNGLFTLAEEQVTLAEILKQCGYATGAAIGAFPVSSQFGLSQGFDFFEESLDSQQRNYLGQRVIPKDRLFFDERKAAQVNEAAIPWLESQRNRPFFFWVHYFDPHQPFEPPPPYSYQYAHDLYSGEIAYTDAALGFLLQELQTLGELDRTLIVMVADHGEGLGEHNEITHAVLAYEQTMHVPLIIRPPAGAAPQGKVVNTRVSTVDIVPTILDLLGIDWPMGDVEVNGLTPASLQGQSLVATWQPGFQAADRVIYGENLSPALTHGWGELRVLYDGSMKYIHGPRPELFDLSVDPDELHNLADQRPDQVQKMRRDLEYFIYENALEGQSEVQDVSPEVVAKLAALGYLKSSSQGDQIIHERLQDGGTPPQDRVGDINDMSGAKHFLFQKRPAEALNFTRRLVQGDPDNVTYLELHISALTGTGRIREAWDQLAKFQQLGSPPEHLILNLAARAFAAGETDSAFNVLEAHVQQNPSAPGLHLLSQFCERLGESERAFELLKSAVEQAPDSAAMRAAYAVQLGERGDVDAAREAFLASLDLDPYQPQAHYNFATFLIKSDSVQEAIPHFRRAVELAPSYTKAHYALVAAYLGCDDLEHAQQAFESLRKIAPRSQEKADAETLLAEFQ